jgi:hypothetical protein
MREPVQTTVSTQRQLMSFHPSGGVAAASLSGALPKQATASASVFPDFCT